MIFSFDRGSATQVEGEALGNDEQEAGGTLEVNISSYGEGKLAVTGTATVAGDVEVLLLGGYVPEEEASGAILTANGGASGEFDSATFVSGGYVWNLTYFDQPDEVILTFLG